MFEHVNCESTIHAGTVATYFLLCVGHHRAVGPEVIDGLWTKIDIVKSPWGMIDASLIGR